MLSARSLCCETLPVTEPIDLLELLGARIGAPAFYWEEPARGLTVAACGAALEFQASGSRRFQELSARASAVLSMICPHSLNASSGGGPLVVGGFGFSDHDCEAHEWREFPAAWFFLPRLLWVRRGTRTTLTRVWEAGGRETLDDLLLRPPVAGLSCERVPWRSLELTQPSLCERERWRERVERARSMVLRSALQKVVLARRIEIEAPSIINPMPIIDAARRTRADCFNFWLGREGTSFLGSTPELLVRVEGQTVTSGALGGSAPRGANDEEDRVLGDSLLASAKNLEEHEYVVSAVRSALESVAGPLYSVERPRLMRLPEVQHLYTPVQGRLRERRSALEVAGLLHPTPAVCGVPRQTARAIIEREEAHRGWYSGAVGWMDTGGGGEFAVALRSALIDGSRMFLWAGAGIVAGSDPEAEFAETETKFSALFRSPSIGSAA